MPQSIYRRNVKSCEMCSPSHTSWWVLSLRSILVLRFWFVLFSEINGAVGYLPVCHLLTRRWLSVAITTIWCNFLFLRDLVLQCFPIGYSHWFYPIVSCNQTLCIPTGSWLQNIGVCNEGFICPFVLTLIFHLFLFCKRFIFLQILKTPFCTEW